MSASVPGIYRDGRIELLEKPAGLREGRVRVTLEADPQQDSTRQIQFGQFSGGTMSTEKDFKAAEWHGEEEWDAH